MRKAIIIDKDLLFKYYIEDKKSINSISELLNLSTTVIRKNLINYGIEIKTASKQLKEIFSIPENNPAYKDGRTSKIYYCLDCGIQISYRTWRHGYNYCVKCLRKHVPFKEERNLKISERIKGKHISLNTEYKNGHQFSKEILDKISNAQKGKHNSLNTEFKIGQNCGDKNNNWNNGSSQNGYSREFTDELKNKIRNKTNHTCSICNITEEEHLIVYGTCLHVHHIDYNKKNHSENNLIPLCVSCHFRTNYNRNYWQAFFVNKLNIETNPTERTPV